MMMFLVMWGRLETCGGLANPPMRRETGDPLGRAQLAKLMPLVFPVLGACINRGAVPLDRGRRPRRPARTLQDADPICSRCGTKASPADQGVCPTTSAALPTVEKRVALACQAAPQLNIFLRSGHSPVLLPYNSASPARRAKPFLANWLYDWRRLWTTATHQQIG